MYRTYTHKLIVGTLAIAVGLLATVGLLLSMAGSDTVTIAAIAAALLLGGWLIITATPRKRVAHVLGLAALGLMVWLGVYVLPIGLIHRVMLGYLTWYAVVEVSAWVRGKG